MVSLSEYELKEVVVNGVKTYWVIRLETVACPVCEGSLGSLGRRERGLIACSGNKILMICRLWCDNCQKIHHEIPDCIVPYKRHSGEDIELAIQTEPNGCDVDNSTIRRWRLWFVDKAENWLGKIVSLFRDKDVPWDLPIIVRFKQYLKCETGWLARVVHMAAN